MLTFSPRILGGRVFTLTGTFTVPIGNTRLRVALSATRALAAYNLRQLANTLTDCHLRRRMLIQEFEKVIFKEMGVSHSIGHAYWQ